MVPVIRCQRPSKIHAGSFVKDVVVEAACRCEPVCVVMSMVGVAQLVERRIVIPVVVGSNPIVHPIFPESPSASCEVL